MKNHIDLGSETIEFVRIRVAEELGENQQNAEKVDFDLKEVKEQILHFFYDYQLVRGWPHVARNTANILGISEMHVHRMIKKRYKRRN